ncbi:MAG: gluconate 2-dehydrogenase subunit 3 family protein [Bryobacteraceae bacterium]|jgi:gluconate 2-dehydrogenase gamma chain
MEEDWKLGVRRREFLGLAGATVLAGASGCGRSSGEWHFLTDVEARALGALCNQIVPADEFPSAVESGVLVFLDRKLTTSLKEFQPIYRGGLATLDRSCVEAFGAPFEALPAERQNALVALLETARPPFHRLRQPSAGEFWRAVNLHTLLGFYGDPRHGGNRGGVSWRMLGIPYECVRGRDHYEFQPPAGGRP